MISSSADLAKTSSTLWKATTSFTAGKETTTYSARKNSAVSNTFLAGTSRVFSTSLAFKLTLDWLASATTLVFGGCVDVDSRTAAASGRAIDDFLQLGLVLIALQAFDDFTTFKN